MTAAGGGEGVLGVVPCGCVKMGGRKWEVFSKYIIKEVNFDDPLDKNFFLCHMYREKMVN